MAAVLRTACFSTFHLFFYRYSPLDFVNTTDLCRKAIVTPWYRLILVIPGWVPFMVEAVLQQ